MTAFPVEKIRDNFPSLAFTDNGRRRIYLDNPAGTQVPQSVADAVRNSFLHDNANLGGHFATSHRSGRVWEEAHVAMADFLAADGPEEIIIGPNMTSLTYQLSRAIGRDWGPDDEVVCTRMDHEGNVGPWMQITADRGATCRFVPFSRESWQVDPDDLRSVLSPRTRLVALGYASNLSGSINDIRALSAIAREAGALVYVDAVQFAPHGLIDASEIGCDFLACSAYKFFGPHLGVVWGAREALDRLVPYKLRCSTNELPGRLETGTPQIELLSGLTAAVDYIAGLSGSNGRRREGIATAFSAIGQHEAQLARQLIEGIASVEGLRIHGISNSERYHWRVPTVSFTVDGIGSQTLVKLLNDENIFCWAGHNYAWEMIHDLGIDSRDGVVRLGIAHYNTAVEIGETVGCVTELIEMLRQQGKTRST